MKQIIAIMFLLFLVLFGGGFFVLSKTLDAVAPMYLEHQMQRNDQPSAWDDLQDAKTNTPDSRFRAVVWFFMVVGIVLVVLGLFMRGALNPLIKNTSGLIRSWKYTPRQPQQENNQGSQPVVVPPQHLLAPGAEQQQQNPGVLSRLLNRGGNDSQTPSDNGNVGEGAWM